MPCFLDAGALERVYSTRPITEIPTLAPGYGPPRPQLRQLLSLDLIEASDLPSHQQRNRTQ